MKIVTSYQFSEEEKEAYMQAAKRKKTLRTFMKTLVASVAAAAIVMGSPRHSDAADFNINLGNMVATMATIVDGHRVGGGAVGAALGSRHDSDVERGAKVAAGVVGGEIVGKTLQGKQLDLSGTLFDAGAGFVGGMWRSKKDSDATAALKATAAIAGANILKRAVQLNTHHRVSPAVSAKPVRDGQGYCRQVVHRHIVNGKVTEVVDEVCNTSTTVNTYGDLNEIMVTSHRPSRSSKTRSLK